MSLAVYSIKIDPAHREGAVKFYGRANLSLQQALRAQIKMAADCEKCLSLVESKAPVEQIQSAFASIIADAKETFHLNGLFRDAIVRGAKSSNLPMKFIDNVIAEAERISVKEPQTG